MITVTERLAYPLLQALQQAQGCQGGEIQVSAGTIVEPLLAAIRTVTARGIDMAAMAGSAGLARELFKSASQ